MLKEDLALEDVERGIRNYSDTHGEPSKKMLRNLNIIKEYLRIYEIPESVLARVSESMYNMSELSDKKEIENNVQTLADTFWD